MQKMYTVNFFWRRAWMVVIAAVGLCVSGCDDTSEVVYPMLYAVREGRSYGFINEGGDMTVSPIYSYAVDFSEGLGAVNIGGTPFRDDMPTNGKWGFVNEYGTFVINPKYYPPKNGAFPGDPDRMSLIMHEGYQFSEGLAAVCMEDGTWQYINNKDQVVIGKKQGLYIRSARKFSEGYAAVYIKNDLTGKWAWGYIDKRGTIRIEPQYLFPVNFHQGHAMVMDMSRRTFCINEQGEAIFRQFRFETGFNDSIAVIREGEKINGERIGYNRFGRMGLMQAKSDSNLTLLVSPQFDVIGRYAEGLAPVLIGSDITRNRDTLSTPEEVILYRRVGGKWGYINKNGRIVLNPVFDEAKGFYNGRAAVRSGVLWGYIDNNGSSIGTAEFKYVSPFRGTLARVRYPSTINNYENRLALINREGEVVWSQPE